MADLHLNIRFICSIAHDVFFLPPFFVCALVRTASYNLSWLRPEPLHLSRCVRLQICAACNVSLIFFVADGMTSLSLRRESACSWLFAPVLPVGSRPPFLAHCKLRRFVPSVSTSVLKGGGRADKFRQEFFFQHHRS